MKVFLSWSGDRSKDVAEALRDWLPTVIQAVKPYASTRDIEVGTRWGTEVSQELEASEFGVVCLTPGNLRTPWLNFEAGAIAKSFERGRIAPYLLDLKPTDLQGPLAQFQACSADEDGTQRLVRGINAALPEPLDGTLLNKAFDAMWPELEGELTHIMRSKPSSAGQRSPEHLLEEILEIVRDQSELMAEERDVYRIRYIPAYWVQAVERQRVRLMKGIAQVESLLGDEQRAVAAEPLERIQRESARLRDLHQRAYEGFGDVSPSPDRQRPDLVPDEFGGE